MLDPSFLHSPATDSSIKCFLFGSTLALDFGWHDAEAAKYIFQWIAGTDILLPVT